MDAGAVATKSKIKGDLAQLLEVLDERSRAILWHLWWHRYAEISELRELIDAPSDFEVLHRLKDVINEKSQRLWSKPIVGFEQSKFDPITGDKVLFSWWFLDEENVPISGGDKPLVDLFDEKDGITIIAELPTSVELSQPDVQIRNGILKVRLKKKGKNARSRLGGNNREKDPGLRIKTKA
jgi:HSP20 family molecular chaperone IbpA